MTLEARLKQLDASERARAVATLMEYPKTASLTSEHPPMLTAFYSCDERDQCSFDGAMKEIKENVEMKVHGVTNVSLAIVKEVREHGDEFLPHKVDGYTMRRGDIDVLRLQRKEKEGATPSTGGRTGFIQLS